MARIRFKRWSGALNRDWHQPRGTGTPSKAKNITSDDVSHDGSGVRDRHVRSRETCSVKPIRWDKHSM